MVCVKLKDLQFVKFSSQPNVHAAQRRKTVIFTLNRQTPGETLGGLPVFKLSPWLTWPYCILMDCHMPMQDEEECTD
jgi:hypothetical protein